MSNSAAIAAVTATLRNLLTEGVSADPDLVDATVTMQPLDRARANGNSANQINIFLYHVAPSNAWRNQPMPGVARPGETAMPPLGLNLYYLITAFGRDNDVQQPFSHQLIGRAMSTLHDHPLLGADEIRSALPNNDLWSQVERVRFTLQPTSVEEISKLWAGFQTQYRLSVAYEAAVVLIESSRRVIAPLPVLRRGKDDGGIIAQANMQFPTIDSVTAPGASTALLGDLLTLEGRSLSGERVSVRLAGSHLAGPIPLNPEANSTDTKLAVKLPADPKILPAGTYTLAAIVGSGDEPDRTSNEVALAIAPKIISRLPVELTPVQGEATIRLTCAPEVRPEQRVALLFGSREIPSRPRDGQTGDLEFVVKDVVPGEFKIRLRVDGIDSHLVDRTQKPPKFIEDQKVTIL